MIHPTDGCCDAIPSKHTHHALKIYQLKGEKLSTTHVIADYSELFVELAASGCAQEALGILVDSPAEPHLEPLVVALRMMIGVEVKSAVAIQEVAKYVVKRIDARKNTVKNALATSQ